MVEVSKHLFDEVCRDVHCSAIIHPWSKNCWSLTLPSYLNFFIGSAKFYIVIHLVNNLLKGKKINNRQELMKAIEYYLRSTLLGGMICGTSITGGCFIRWLIGRKFTYYTYILIPSMINGFFILLEPPSRRGLVINLFCNMVIEYWLRSLDRAGYVSVTNKRTTILFMLGSSLLFYLMRLEGESEKRTPILWLYTPEKVRHKTKGLKNACPHSGPCLKYILKGGATYFGVGLSFTIVSLLRPLLKSPSKTLASFGGKHLKLAMFFGSYIGIYRLIICYLCRKRGYDSALYALPAGLLAGLSFQLKPSLGIAIASITGAFKIYSKILYKKKILTNRINIPILLYCFCQGTLFHARYMHPEVCPSYVFNLMSSVSNGCVDVSSAHFYELLKQGHS